MNHTWTLKTSSIIIVKIALYLAHLFKYTSFIDGLSLNLHLITQNTFNEISNTHIWIEMLINIPNFGMRIEWQTDWRTVWVWAHTTHKHTNKQNKTKQSTLQSKSTDWKTTPFAQTKMCSNVYKKKHDQLGVHFNSPKIIFGWSKPTATTKKQPNKKTRKIVSTFLFNFQIVWSKQ